MRGFTVFNQIFCRSPGPHIPIWSRALSSPARATGISTWAPTSPGSNRPRSASAPLVLYKQKYTLQFDRQMSLMSSWIAKYDEDSSKSLKFIAIPFSLFLLDQEQKCVNNYEINP